MHAYDLCYNLHSWPAKNFDAIPLVADLTPGAASRSRLNRAALLGHQYFCHLDKVNEAQLCGALSGGGGTASVSWRSAVDEALFDATAGLIGRRVTEQPEPPRRTQDSSSRPKLSPTLRAPGTRNASHGTSHAGVENIGKASKKSKMAALQQTCDAL